MDMDVKVPFTKSDKAQTKESKARYINERKSALDRSLEARSSLYGQVYDVLSGLQATGVPIPALEPVDIENATQETATVRRALSRAHFIDKYIKTDESILDAFPDLVERRRSSAPPSREGSPLTPIDSPVLEGDKVLHGSNPFRQTSTQEEQRQSLLELFSPEPESGPRPTRPTTDRAHAIRRSPSFMKSAAPLESPTLPISISPAMLMLAGSNSSTPIRENTEANPIASDFAAHLPALPQEILRNRIAIGGLTRKKREKDRERVTGLSGGNELYRLGVARPTHCGVRHHIGQPIPGQGSPIRPAKAVMTSDWNVAINELAGLRAMERIEELKQQHLWGFRQLKKQKGPTVAKSHWDYLLEEMKWLQTDVRQERRWKMTTAASLAHAVLDWHLSDVDERREMCIRVRPPRALEAPKASEPATASAVAQEDEGDVEMDDAVEVQQSEEPIVASEVSAINATENAQEESTTITTENTQEVQVPTEDTPQIKIAQTPTPGTSLSYDQLVILRAPLFHQPETTTVITLSQLPLDKSIPAEADERNRTELLNGLVPDIPLYEAPHPPPQSPESKHSHAHDRRHDESSTHHSRLTQVSRLFDAKPILLSVLNPAKKRRRDGSWQDLSDLNWQDPREAENKPEAPPASSSLFYGRRPRDLTQGMPMSIPPAPTEDEAALEARAAGLDWTEAEDNLLLSLSKVYSHNWHLIADVFNGSTVRTQTDRRDKFDVYARWNKRFGPGSQPTLAETGPNGLPKEVPKNAPKEAGRKTIHHMSLYDGVKAMQKRREMQPPKNAPNAPREVRLKSHDSHIVVSRTPLMPTEIIRNKYEAEKKELAARQANERIMRQQQQLLMQQAQAQQVAQQQAAQQQAQAQAQAAQQAQRMALPPNHQLAIQRPASQASNQSGHAASPPQFQQGEHSPAQFPALPPNLPPVQAQQLANYARMNHQGSPVNLPLQLAANSPVTRLRKESL